MSTIFIDRVALACVDKTRDRTGWCVRFMDGDTEVVLPAMGRETAQAIAHLLNGEPVDNLSSVMAEAWRAAHQPKGAAE